MSSIDWDAPLDADGEARSGELRAALGTSVPDLAQLLATLRNGLTSDAWGFSQLADIADEEQRAVVSDQVLSAAEGLQDALVDAGISAYEVRDLTGPNGIAYAAREDSLNDMLKGQKLRRAVASFFDATGTALDCLAAVLIVVVRMPLSVQRADYYNLITLDTTKDYPKAFDVSFSQAQRQIWDDLQAELAAAAGQGPTDWLPWSLEMRNALTHRGRVTDVFMPRKISGRLALPPSALSQPQRNYRYDLHLRSRPWLPGIEQMLAGPELPDSWLGEPATTTIDGLRDALATFCERLASWAEAQWVREPYPTFAPPVHRWTLPIPPQISFAGIRPGNTVEISGAIGGVNEQHLRMAERLRRRRAGLPDLS